MTRDVGGAFNLGVESPDDRACLVGVAVVGAVIAALCWWWTR